MRLLTIGAEYKGSMALFGCGITSANVFEDQILKTLSDKPSVHLRLRGHECNQKNIISYFTQILNDLDNEKVIIYYAGHGDRAGGKEFWHTVAGNIDQQRIARMINEIEDDSLVYLFSESCSSEHMCNIKLAKKNYISIGATLDHEDAIITSDGGVMTCTIINILKEIHIDFTLRDFWHKMMLSGVTIEHFSLRYSHEKFLDEKMF